MLITNLVADWFLTAIILLCGFTHFAILRTPDIPETFIGEAMRRIKITGYFLTGGWWFYLMVKFGDIPIPVLSQLGLTLVFGAEFYKTLYVLFKHTINEQPRIKKQQLAEDAEEAAFIKGSDDAA
jgi:hypothetical protein